MPLASTSTMIFKMFKEGTGSRRRNLTLGSLCIGSICIGLTLGWPDSTLSYLILTRNDSTGEDFPKDGCSMVQMVINFGSCIGALVPSCVADTYGRRLSFAIAGVLNCTFWAIIFGVDGYLAIIIGAAIGGIASGVFVTTTALYVSEISLPHTRCTTGALIAFCAYFGILVGSCLIFVTFARTVELIMGCLALFFLASLHWWMVESPYFLFLKGKTMEAKLSLKALRGARTVLEIDPEYRTIELFFRVNQIDSNENRPNRVCSSLSMSRKRRCAILVIIFLCVTQMVGAYGMNDYSKHFFDTVLPNYGHITISFLDVCSIGLYIYLIEKLGKKTLILVISIVGSSVTCLVLAIFVLTKERTEYSFENNDTSRILPATLVAIYFVIYSLGLTPVMPIITGEIFSSRYKTVALSSMISFIYLSSMIIQFVFETLNAKHSSSLAFASFSIFGALGIPLVFAFLPDTHGKTLYQIQREFEDFPIILT